MTGPRTRTVDPAGDPDLDRCPPACRCPRCGRDDADVYNDGVGCLTCNAEIEAMLAGGVND